MGLLGDEKFVKALLQCADDDLCVDTRTLSAYTGAAVACLAARNCPPMSMPEVLWRALVAQLDDVSVHVRVAACTSITMVASQAGALEFTSAEKILEIATLHTEDADSGVREAAQGLVQALNEVEGCVGRAGI